MRRSDGPVGLIGVGLLGLSLAERLLGAGLDVVGTDMNPARLAELEQLGGRAEADATAVVVTSQRVVLSLPTSQIVGEVLSKLGPSLRSGQIIVDTTTGEPADAEAAARMLGSLGVAYLDATVSGSSAQARRGEVVVLCGGPTTAFEACRDLFEAFARESFHVGAVGAGSRMKLATNLVLGLNRAALAEGLAFAESMGLDPARTLEVLRAGAAYSRVMDAKGPKMVAGDFAPEARLSQHLKDVRLILEEAGRCGAAVPLSEVHRQLLEMVEQSGYGVADNSAIRLAFRPRHPSGGGPAAPPTP